jgi:phage terminase small subunit
MEITNEVKKIELRLQQEKFCYEYLIDFNATKAAIRAGYSEVSAYSQGHDLLKKPEIKKFIEQLSKAGFEAIGLSRNRLILELAASVSIKKALYQVG